MVDNGTSYKDKLYVLKESNMYKILGVANDVDLETISREYKSLAKKYHPDRHPNLNEAEKKEVSLIFQKITTAFNTLKDSEQRKKHDFELKILEKSAKPEIKIPDIKQSAPVTPNVNNTNNSGGGISFTFTQMKPVDLEQIRAEKEKKDKERATIDFTQAKKLMSEKKFDDAIAILRNLTEKFGAVATYHSHLGLAMLEKGWGGYAQAEFKVALHFDPNDEIAKKNYVPSGSSKKEKKEENIDMNSTQNLKSVMGKFKSLFGK